MCQGPPTMDRRPWVPAKPQIASLGSLVGQAACCSCPRETSLDDGDVTVQDESSGSQTSEARAPRRLLSLDASLEQPVEGCLVRQGVLLMLDGAENCMKPWTILLFSNGFYAVPHGAHSPGGHDGAQSFGWSPFAEVRELAVDPEDKSCPFRCFSAFTVYLFRQDVGFVFATKGEGAAKERHRWVAAMAGTVQGFTQSLFPPFSIAAFPVDAVPSTRTRVLAGYLLRDEGGGVVSAPYCELHANCRSSAILVMYEAECCERVDGNIFITDSTQVWDRNKSECPCFAVDVWNFCARSVREKSLWLRALENIKVKLRCSAPDPSSEELLRWREAVLESARVAAEEASPSAVPRSGASAVQRGLEGSPPMSAPGRRYRLFTSSPDPLSYNAEDIGEERSRPPATARGTPRSPCEEGSGGASGSADWPRGAAAGCEEAAAAAAAPELWSSAAFGVEEDGVGVSSASSSFGIRPGADMADGSDHVMEDWLRVPTLARGTPLGGGSFGEAAGSRRPPATAAGPRRAGGAALRYRGAEAGVWGPAGLARVDLDVALQPRTGGSWRPLQGPEAAAAGRTPRVQGLTPPSWDDPISPTALQELGTLQVPGAPPAAS